VTVEGQVEPPPVPFKQFAKTAAKKFLRTAIVIDDDISANSEAAVADVIESPPFLVEGVTEKPATNEAAATSVRARELADEPNLPSDVPIKPLADAFLDKQIVCGVLKPTNTDDAKIIVDRAVRAALVADIVIIDWYLRKGDDSLALSILAEILTKDRESNGRLRLVLVYTSAVPLNDRRDALVSHLAKHGIECKRVGKEELLLQADDCRIKFVQKKNGDHGETVDALPDMAIEEFAQHSSGLLSNFALLGIGALREATHHLLSTFDRRVDPAFVGHRLLVRETEGARELAMSLFMLQVKGLLSLPEHLGNALGNDELGSWFDESFGSAEAEDKLKTAGVTKQVLRAHLLGNGDLPKKTKKFHDALFPLDARRNDAGLASLEDTVSKDFARLATFVREFNGFNPLPPKWIPTLTLGSVVKVTIGGAARYLLCVQPACDTVRIEDGIRYFPFIDLIDKKFDYRTENLVIKDGDTTRIVCVNSKAGARHYDNFEPDEQTKSIRANTKVDEKIIGGLFFTSVGGTEYQWLGDIDAMKAQRIAVDLSGALARVGIDEYEWLRQGGLVGK
jgi:Response receiver domain